MKTLLALLVLICALSAVAQDSVKVKSVPIAADTTLSRLGVIQMLQERRSELIRQREAISAEILKLEGRMEALSALTQDSIRVTK